MGWPRSRRGVAHQRPGLDSPGGGQERPGAGALHQGRLVPLAGRVPQAGRLAHAQHAAPAEQPRSGGVQADGRRRVLDIPHPEPGPGGVVVVAVGGHQRGQQFADPGQPLRFRG